MMILIAILALGLADTFVHNKTSFYLSEPLVNLSKSHFLPERKIFDPQNSFTLFLSKRSILNGYPKRRKEYKRPHWYDLFEEEVEKEPLGPYCSKLTKDVIEGKRRLRFTLKKTKNQMYATIFDDVTRETLCFVATNFKYLSHIFGTVPTKNPNILRNKGGNIKAAYELGKLIGKQALSRGISKVFFDRAGYRYQGRVEALAIGARKVGLEF